MNLSLGPFGKVSLIKLVVYVAVVAGLIYFLHLLGTGFQNSQVLQPEAIQGFIDRFGIWSWMLYLALLTLFVMSPLPSSMLTVVGGYLFDPFIAFALTIVGETVGGIANFAIGKVLARMLMTGERFPRVTRFFATYGSHLNFRTIFVLALIPVGTSNFTGYAAAMGGMKLGRYLAPWIAGITVLAVVATLLGQSAKHDTPLISIIIVLAVLVIIGFQRWWMQRRIQKGK